MARFVVARSIYFATSVSLGVNGQLPLGQRKAGLAPVSTEELDKLLERSAAAGAAAWAPVGRLAEDQPGCRASEPEGEGALPSQPDGGQSSASGQRPTSDIQPLGLIADLRLEKGPGSA